MIDITEYERLLESGDNEEFTKYRLGCTEELGSTICREMKLIVFAGVSMVKDIAESDRIYLELNLTPEGSATYHTTKLSLLESKIINEEFSVVKIDKEVLDSLYGLMNDKMIGDILKSVNGFLKTAFNRTIDRIKIPNYYSLIHH